MQKTTLSNSLWLSATNSTILVAPARVSPSSHPTCHGRTRCEFRDLSNTTFSWLPLTVTIIQRRYNVSRTKEGTLTLWLKSMAFVGAQSKQSQYSHQRQWCNYSNAYLQGDILILVAWSTSNNYEFIQILNLQAGDMCIHYNYT